MLVSVVVPSHQVNLSRLGFFLINKRRIFTPTTKPYLVHAGFPLHLPQPSTIPTSSPSPMNIASSSPTVPLKPPSPWPSTRSSTTSTPTVPATISPPARPTTLLTVGRSASSSSSSFVSFCSSPWSFVVSFTVLLTVLHSISRIGLLWTRFSYTSTSSLGVPLFSL